MEKTNRTGPRPNRVEDIGSLDFYRHNHCMRTPSELKNLSIMLIPDFN